MSQLKQKVVQTIYVGIKKNKNPTILNVHKLAYLDDQDKRMFWQEL